MPWMAINSDITSGDVGQLLDAGTTVVQCIGGFGCFLRQLRRQGGQQLVASQQRTSACLPDSRMIAGILRLA
jgi:hypothetical protein